MEEVESPRGSQAITRALSVLRAFTADRLTLTMTEMSRELNVSTPTAHRIAHALEQQGYLTRDPVTRGYSLGPEIRRLSALVTETRKSTLDPVRLRNIRNATGETVGLHTRVFDRRVCVAEHPSSQSPSVFAGVGRTYSLIAGAAGKAILSLLPEDEVQHLIGLGADPGDDPLPAKQLLVDIRNAREQGYATSSGETIPGAFAIAVALPWNGNGAASAISVVGPADRMKPDVIDRALESIAHMIGTPTRRRA
jgi:IclR family transcriptional regulator, acetate operon repressor